MNNALKEKENSKNIPHNLILKERSILQLSGIIDLENFNDQTITAYTSEEGIVISGENLHIKKLNLELGELCINGKISSLTYINKVKKQNRKESFFSKIFK